LTQRQMLTISGVVFVVLAIVGISLYLVGQEDTAGGAAVGALLVAETARRRRRSLQAELDQASLEGVESARAAKKAGLHYRAGKQDTQAAVEETPLSDLIAEENER